MRHGYHRHLSAILQGRPRGFSEAFELASWTASWNRVEFGVASQRISRTALGISREDRDRHNYMMLSQRESSDTVFLGVVTKRAIGHFQKVGSTDANAPGTLERGQQVTALKIANLLLKIYAALGNQHLFV